MAYNLPLVSVIIPTRNRKIFLRRALESVFGQTYKNIQIIVVDDASTDGTEDMILSIQRSSLQQELLYIRNAHPEGGARARNTGIRQAKGEFVSFLDDDDEWLPEKTAIQADFLMHNPEYAGVSCLYYQECGDASRLSAAKEEVTFQDMLWGNICGSFSFAMTRREQVIYTSGINESLPSSQDWDFWLKMAAIGKIKVIQSPLAIYNVGNHDRISTRYRDIYGGYRKIFLQYSRAMQRQCRLHHIRFLLHIRYRLVTGKRDKLRFLLKSLRFGPSPLIFLDMVNLFLPQRIFRMLKNIFNRLGIFPGRSFLHKASMPTIENDAF